MHFRENGVRLNDASGKWRSAKRRFEKMTFDITLEIPSNEIPSNERSLIRARYRSLRRAADHPLFPHYYGIKRARIWNSS